MPSERTAEARLPTRSRLADILPARFGFCTWLGHRVNPSWCLVVSTT